MPLPTFKASRPLTVGVELELQLLDRYDYSLAPAAADLLYWVRRHPDHPGQIVPEITQGMIEISTGVHENHTGLLDELRRMGAYLSRAARSLHIAIAGGGAHAFQHWGETRIYPSARFHRISDLYGYLARQFTVFGQHIHIGCENGDQALYLLHAMARYLPHLIALSACSPYLHGYDSGFASARLNAIAAFPLSGRAPFLSTWSGFEGYFEKMTRTGVVASMKDFYWDIRPKPEYGTIEVRICDTPLTFTHAADLAAYVQTLCRYLLQEQEEASSSLSEDIYLAYSFNRFQASRFGLAGVIVEPVSGEHRVIAEDILDTLGRLEPHAVALGAVTACRRIRSIAARGENDADWCRRRGRELDSLSELMRACAHRWEEDAAAADSSMVQRDGVR